RDQAEPIQRHRPGPARGRDRRYRLQDPRERRIGVVGSAVIAGGPSRDPLDSTRPCPSDEDLGASRTKRPRSEMLAISVPRGSRSVEELVEDLTSAPAIGEADAPAQPRLPQPHTDRQPTASELVERCEILHESPGLV